MTYPSVYPTGTTIYNPEKCWNGFTIFQARELGALLIDMNGAEIRLWKGLHGFPNKILPGGYVMGHTEKEAMLTACRIRSIWCGWTGKEISFGSSTSTNLLKIGRKAPVDGQAAPRLRGKAIGGILC